MKYYRKAGLKIIIPFGLIVLLVFPFQLNLFGKEKERIIAIKGGKIYTASEMGPIEEGIILIKNDRIFEIGTEVVIPPEAEVFDFKDKFIMPGVVSPDSNLGVFKPTVIDPRYFFFREESPGKNLANYPVFYSIYPDHPYFNLALQHGFTTLALSPPAEGISGLGAVIHPSGETLQDMLVRDRVFLKVNVYVNTPFWKMMKGALEEAQKKLDELKKEREKKEAEKKEKKTKNKKGKEEAEKKKEKPRLKETTKIFMEVLKGKIPILAECQGPDAIAHILELFSQYPKIKFAVRGGPDTFKAGHLLKGRNIPIILEPKIHSKTSFYAPYPERTNYVLKCQGLDLKIALQAPGDIEEQMHFYHFLNGLYQLGVKKDVLLKGATIVPAQILGLDHLIGSLEKGKKADMIIFRSDPLDNVPVVEKVMLGGKFIQ